MILLVLLSCIIAISHQSRSPLEIRQHMLTESLECTRERPVNAEEMRLMMNHELPGTRNSKCFIACVFRKFGWLNDKGMFDLDATSKFADDEYVDEPDKKENAKKLFDTCKPVNDEATTDGEEGCDRSNSLAKCLIDNASKMRFHIDLGTDA